MSDQPGKVGAMPSLEQDLEDELLQALEADSSDEEDASSPSSTGGGGEGQLGKRNLPDSVMDRIPASKRQCYSARNLETRETLAILAQGEMVPTSTAPSLMSLSAPCILSIISRLSPEDLCSLAQTNRYFRVAASDPGIWRALFNHRWTSGPSDGDADSLADGTFDTSSRWKEMYLQRDGAEVAAEARRAPEEARDMFLAMTTARRSEPLSPKAAAEINPLLGTALAERVAAFRRIRGLHNNDNNANNTTQDLPGGSSSLPSTHAAAGAAGAQRPLSRTTPPASQNNPDSPHTATCNEGCSFVELEANYWICEKGGHVHICGEACTARLVDNVSEMLVCSLTGRCFPRLMSEWEETRGRGGNAGAHGNGDEDGDGGARDGDDWNEVTGMGGRLGRAFFAGYNAADEREMLLKFGIRM